jgi:hypothetical protein
VIRSSKPVADDPRDSSSSRGVAGHDSSHLLCDWVGQKRDSLGNGNGNGYGHGDGDGDGAMMITATATAN